VKIVIGSFGRRTSLLFSFKLGRDMGRRLTGTGKAKSKFGGSSQISIVFFAKTLLRYYIVMLLQESLVGFCIPVAVIDN